MKTSPSNLLINSDDSLTSNYCSRKIFLTGASGFIGGHILSALIKEGHQVTVLARGAAVKKLSIYHNITIVQGEWLKPEGWFGQLVDHDIVINSIGIIREQGRATFGRVHGDIPIRLFVAAASAGVKKIIQISAMGVDERAVTNYHLSKRIADHTLMQLDLPYLILRPSFVYGPGDISMKFFTRLAKLPFTPVPGDGEYLVQPVHVRDLTRAVKLACENLDMPSLSLELGGSEIITFNTMLDLLAQKYGRKQAAYKFHIPMSIMKIIAAITDRLGFGPITSEELLMLSQGSHGDTRQFIEHFNFVPMPFSLGLNYR